MKRFYLIGLLVLGYAFKCAAQYTEIWGMTSEGGVDDLGVIFKTDTSGSQIIVYEWEKTNDAKYPAGDLCKASNGKLFGLTSYGGQYNKGVLYEYDPTTNIYTKKIDFDGTNGKTPKGGLIQLSNGKLYGLTSAGGGSFNGGTLFEYDPSTNTLTKKLSFSGTSNGREPNGHLTLAGNGKLYGLTSKGGTYNYGVLFEYDITTGICIKKIDFDGSSKGQQPEGSLTLANNNKLYGMTYYGGVHGKGVMFEFDPNTGVFVKRVDFNGTSKGAYPNGDLTVIDTNIIYGIVRSGGTGSSGVIFEYNTTTNTFTKKFDFIFNNHGHNPQGRLVKANSGKLYGVSEASIYCYLFEYDTLTSTITNIVPLSPLRGRYPRGAVTIDNNIIYGTTSDGGADISSGILFKYDITNDSISKLLDFNGPNQGSCPKGDLMMASDGNLYGMTSKGGDFGSGVIFKLDTSNHAFTKILDFNDTVGAKPQGHLIQASNGKLYGMTRYGGSQGSGTIIEYDLINDTVIKKTDFINTSHGSRPNGSMMEASDGFLYGMTYYGGTNNRGIIFRYNTLTDSITKLIDMNYNDGCYPKGDLIEASNGLFYGLTSFGGWSSDGVIFEYDPNLNTYTKKITFDEATTGKNPQGRLIQLTNDKLYGVTLMGGTGYYGVLFEYDISDSAFTKKVEFDGSSMGRQPWGSLMLTKYGTLIGMTQMGGTYGYGNLFEYDPFNNQLSNILSFNGTSSGKYPVATPIDLGVCDTSYNSFSTISCGNYTVPSGDETYSTPGSYIVYDTIPNSCGYSLILTINLTINSSTVSNDSIIACDSLIWIDGNTYYNNNSSAVFTTTNANGCDSIISLNLTIGNSYNVYDSHIVCDSFTWIDGITYYANNQSGTYLMQTNMGCDSIVNLNLSINPSPIVVLDPFNPDSICKSVGTIYLPTANYAGGTFTGNGVNGSILNLSTIPYGPNWVYYSYTDTNSCFGIDSTKVEVLNCTNLPDARIDQEIRIYPNPNNGIFYVDYKNYCEYKVINSVGVSVLVGTNRQNNKIDLSHFSKGVYYLIIKSNKSYYSTKIIIN